MKKNDNDPWIRAFDLSLTPPNLNDNKADADRLVKGIRKEIQGEDVIIGYSILNKIPALLREFKYRARPVIYKSKDAWNLIDLFPPGNGERIFGLAVDLGSSSVFVRIFDLASSEILGDSSFNNPQNSIGADILTRIHFTSREGGLEKLQSLLIDRLNREILTLAQRHGIDRNHIVGMSLAGNTTMTHLFLGLDPFGICREPYIPAVNSPDLIKSKELGLKINPEAPLLILPGAGSYLGGDIIAGIMASGLNRQKEIGILVDVGTNAEVVLGNRDWLMACAGAAGPALEGGVANIGMMAGPGVIDKVKIDPESKEFHIWTIDDMPPLGICGSGLIDLAAELFLSGMINIRGKFVPNRCGERLFELDGVKHLVVNPSLGAGKELTISQIDIDALLRSKAAMFTILATITKMINVPIEEILSFYLSGTFGSFINPVSAISLGMIPDIPLDRYHPLGNTSLTGAGMALLSSNARDEVCRIRDKITYIELNVNQEFMNEFSAAKFIPHTDRSLFPNVREWSPNR